MRDGGYFCNQPHLPIPCLIHQPIWDSLPFNRNSVLLYLILTSLVKRETLKRRSWMGLERRVTFPRSHSKEAALPGPALPSVISFPLSATSQHTSLDSQCLGTSESRNLHQCFSKYLWRRTSFCCCCFVGFISHPSWTTGMQLRPDMMYPVNLAIPKLPHDLLNEACPWITRLDVTTILNCYQSF